MARTARRRFLEEYPDALADEAGAVFIGAGVSMGAGYPSWTALLHEIGEELGVNSSDVHDLAALAQWSVHTSGGHTRIRKVIRENMAVVHPVPDTLKVIARLPIRHLWTTNYDRLIERSFEEIARPLDVFSGSADLSIRARPGAARLYKMHGSVDRLDDLVISTDDYELFRSKRGAYLPLLQAHLTSMSMLFVGLSFADPNIKHVLSLIRESFTEAPPEHFAIVRPPQVEDFRTKAEFEARAAQHSLWARDLQRYGLVAVEIDDYAEVPDLLRQIERRVARRRIWVSGSWPIAVSDGEAAYIYAVSEGLGRAVGQMGLSLVTGAGLLVGSATIAGFLDSLRAGGGWDLERRLIARPFPQPLDGKSADRAQWSALRGELARLAGVVIFVGGAKLSDSKRIIADGVIEEFEQAKAAGAFLLPISATGGAAKEIAERLMGSDLSSDGDAAVRPNDEELQALANADLGTEKLVQIAVTVLQRALKGDR